MTTALDLLACGPGLPEAAGTAWHALLTPLRETTAGTVAVNRGWDLDWERARWDEAAAAGHEHLSVRLYDDEVLIGPRYVPGTDAGCAGCTEARDRLVLDHPLTGDLTRPRTTPGADDPFLAELTRAALQHLAELPLRPSELYAVGGRTTRRHRVPRSFHCPVCGLSPAERKDASPPEPLVLQSRPAAKGDPTRGREGAWLMRRGALRDRLVDPRFGPVQAIMRESRAPFAMSMAKVPGAPAMGHGRAQTFAETEPVAVLEAYERLAGFPFDTPVLTDLAYRDIADRALDPHTLGQYTPEQLAHPSCRVIPFAEDTAMDWAWGRDLETCEPVLVPAEIAFYHYDYRYKLDRRAASAAGIHRLEHYFLDSSSGCAVGASLEEAALHSLLELAERDAFLLSWYRAMPLPYIPQSTVTDPTCRALIDLIEAHGYEVHILVATQDIAVPVIWVLVANRENPFPATFHSAGSGAHPDDALRGALREVAQLVSIAVDWEQDEVTPMIEDPWKVEELDHHVQYSTHPAARDRATTVLGGPRTSMGEAFPDWPDGFRERTGGDIRDALEHVRDLFADAGLERIVLVDQTSREHADIGIRVAKAVVPGILPMCFGHAQQRLANLPRLEAALRGTPQEGCALPHDPHPFP
ncbi:TOMM precursor leader peptide-binding protein [Streptomyces afghaniensis]|uniref:TOMM precursor leader peptide-binding protein n=1 Tax=Streptomyces afghaniensis TaxID=66865 RepID=UPI0033A970FD